MKFSHLAILVIGVTVALVLTRSLGDVVSPTSDGSGALVWFGDIVINIDWPGYVKFHMVWSAEVFEWRFDIGW